MQVYNTEPCIIIIIITYNLVVLLVMLEKKGRELGGCWERELKLEGAAVFMCASQKGIQE